MKFSNFRRDKDPLPREIMAVAERAADILDAELVADEWAYVLFILPNHEGQGDAQTGSCLANVDAESITRVLAALGAMRPEGQ